MSIKPTKALNDYFSNVLSLNVNENVYARKVAEAFEIESAMDLWKISAYIEYSTDEAGGFYQQMQSLDFTMWRGQGDCEDYARALVKVAKAIGLKAYYWLVFDSIALNNGHAMSLVIDRDSKPVAINYTELYKANIKISETDIKNNTSKFQQAMRWLNSVIFPFQRYWEVSWIIKTDSNEKPLWYQPAPVELEPGDVQIVTYPQSRFLVLKYMQKLELLSRLSTSDYILPLGLLGLAGFVMWRWLT